MFNWPYWLYRILFFQRGIEWAFRIRKFSSYGQIMHFSPIDSSFTYCRIHVSYGDWWLYPIVCVAGYQPNAGMKLFLFHKEIFDFTEYAKKKVANREGWIK